MSDPQTTEATHYEGAGTFAPMQTTEKPEHAYRRGCDDGAMGAQVEIDRQINEIERLRAALAAIGNLSDADADNRSWMARDALAGRIVTNGR
jgi:hypothetical protein